MEETSVEAAGTKRTFDYQEYVSREAKAVSLYSLQKKIDLQWYQGQATVRHGIEEKGGGVVSWTVDGPENWLKVEAVAGE